jgi:hypothetical protein
MPTPPTPIDAAPDAPDKNDRATFNLRAYNWAVYQKDTLVPGVNASGTNVYANAVEAAEAAEAAAVSEAAAAAVVIDAEAHRDAAAALANYKGLYTAQVGALAIPASVYHLTTFWALTENVADVTLEVPGTSTKWVAVTSGRGAEEPAAGSVTLTAGSRLGPYWAVTAHGQSLKLPDATTLVAGREYLAVNPTQYFGRVLDANDKLVGILAPMSSAPISNASTATAGGKWNVAGSPLFAKTSIAAFAGASLGAVGATSTKIIPIVLDAQRTLVLVGNTALWAVVHNKVTGAWGAATLVRASIGAAAFGGIKSAADQVLVVSSLTTAMEAVVLSVAGTTVTVNAAVGAALAGGITTGFSLSSGSRSFGDLVQYDATTFLVPYTRTASTSGLRAVTIAGTVPTVGAEVTQTGNAGGVPSHVFVSGAMILAHNGVNAHCYTVAAAVLTQTGTCALTSVSGNLFKSLALGARWLVLASSGGSQVNATLISVAAGVPTQSNVLAVVTGFTSLPGYSFDVQVANGKAVVCAQEVSTTSVKLNVLTDTAGVLSKGTELTMPALGILQGYSPVAIGASGTDAAFLYNNLVLRVSAAGASPVVTGVNGGSAASSSTTATELGHVKSTGAQSNARQPNVLYSGSLAIIVPAGGSTTGLAADGAATAVATNYADAAPFRRPAPHAFVGPAALNANGAALGSTSESWDLVCDAITSSWVISCFEAIQP